MLNVTHIKVGADNLARVLSSPQFTKDLLMSYSRSSLKASEGTTFLDKLKDACRKSVSSLQEKGGVPPEVEATVDVLCRNPLQPFEALGIVLGIVLLLFFVVIRPILSVLSGSKSTTKQQAVPKVKVDKKNA